MQAIILSAGLGSRMGDTEGQGIKTMTLINSTPLLQLTIENLISFGISKATIVVGHNNSIIQDYFGTSYKGLDIDYVFNPDYKTKNNIYSMWLCKQHLIENDTFIIEGDVVFERSLLHNIHKKGENVMGVTKYEPWMNGTIIEFDISGNPKFTKGIYAKKNSKKLKTLNIYKFSKQFSVSVYAPLLEKKIVNKEFNLYYEDVINTKILKKYFVLYEKKTHEKCFELDTPHDLHTSKLIFSMAEERYETLTTSYGGLWKSSGILDYYYLTNPYFPSDEFIEEFSNVSKSLIVNYPSGRKIIDAMAAAIFNVPKEFIVVSNGASEIIEVLSRSFTGTFGIFIPTFDEYANRIGAVNTVLQQIPQDDFEITLEDIQAISEKASNIILVNPNNPTGKILSKKTLLEVLFLLKNKNKKLIIDESFADFSTDNISLVDFDILKKFPNLFIVKSLGKSYGIPGLRIGIFLTSNQSFIQKMRTSLPIWNINSFAEYFFEAFPRYKKVFANSCKKVQEDREEFLGSLLNIPDIKVWRSQSNFILCELLKVKYLDKFSIDMLDIYNIFIKNCQPKLGIQGRALIRVAVRTKKENKLFVKALAHLLLSEHYNQ